ncbi:hypothetical protein SAMN05216226_101273 [Halovenus aranensis]|uniref:Uncharacterized protein n=2 Tax=Halovenus aranensis TaxID=890420 RepID=A0A1G8S594_9EURY|nr:hypothetical protein SAMN05216226_101273 [Halovenus aranensis]
MPDPHERRRSRTEDTPRPARRTVLAASATLATAGIAGCSGDSNAESEPTETPNPTQTETETTETPETTPTEAPQVVATNIEFVEENGDEVKDLAQVNIQTSGNPQPDAVNASINGQQVGLTPTEDGFVSDTVPVNREGSYTAQVETSEQVETEQGSLEDTAEYFLTNGPQFSQREDTPGIIDIHLEPDQETPGTLERLSENVLEASVKVDDQEQNIQLQKTGDEPGYHATVNAYKNSEITEDISIVLNQLQDFKLAEDNLTAEATQINPENKITAEQVYKNQSTESVLTEEEIENLENYQNGKPTNLGQLIKELNKHADATRRQLTKDYKTITHQDLGINTDQIKAIERTSTSGENYTAIFYRENTDTNWKKALAEAQSNKKTAPEAVLLPGEEVNPMDFEAKRILHGLHDHDDTGNVASIDFEQMAGIIDNSNTEENLSESEWEENLERGDKYNDSLVIGETPGDIEIGYTPDVRGYLGDIIHPRDGDAAKELELIESATEYLHNAVPEDRYMQIDVAETVEEGEELIDLEDGNTMYATTVDEETHKENVMEIYDLDDN